MIEYTEQQLEDIVTALAYQIADKEELIRTERANLSDLQYKHHYAMTKLAYLKGVNDSGTEPAE